MIYTTFTDVDKLESYVGTEPLTLADVKAHVRVDFTDDDAVLTAMITAARQSIEEYCHISLVPKIITLTMECTNVPSSLFTQPFQNVQNFNSFELPYGPIMDVSSVTSIDSDGSTVLSLLLGSDYFLTGKYFQTIKITNQFTNNIIVYLTGYQTLPQALKLAIMNEIAYRYSLRGDSQPIRASAFTEQGVCVPARILAEPYKRLISL